VLTIFIILTLSVIALSTITERGQSFGGKARDVNMKLLEKRIIEKTLSDKEAEFYEKVR
jgi:hypothetical protein